ncbi:rhodanese-like domain-containing protein [Proteocatella sphenisci]|uniref:rhodanese-like domain-containing protein n=1 Tax=Proteocatella sphenisci TaxID=181070 RepID=UPI00048B748C|nr:rhodanese-like domain-containing protein [Proteocatella sphenisci]
MRKIIITVLIALLSVFMLSGCKATNESDPDSSPESQEQAPSETESSTYIKLTPEQAKEIMDTEDDIIILDVRTQEEFDTGHIEGAVLIPNTEIRDKAKDVLKDKDQKILVYCRSGNRSQMAAAELISMGYTKVYDFGGIIDWPY